MRNVCARSKLGLPTPLPERYASRGAAQKNSDPPCATGVANRECEEVRFLKKGYRRISRALLPTVVGHMSHWHTWHGYAIRRSGWLDGAEVARMRRTPASISA